MLKEDILQLLKAGKDTYLSGQRISAQLGVSRRLYGKPWKRCGRTGTESIPVPTAVTVWCGCRTS